VLQAVCVANGAPGINLEAEKNRFNCFLTDSRMRQLQTLRLQDSNVDLLWG
jgi:hypothetical protein